MIGGRVYPKPSSQPPSTVYWNALAVWGILRPRPDGRTISRAQAHRLLKSVGAATGDDGQPLLSFEPPFAPLPDRPDSWQSGTITLQLAMAEATFLRERLAQLRRNGGHELSLLARLVRTEVAAPSAMWADETRAIAGSDQASLVRAQQAGGRSGPESAASVRIQGSRGLIIGTISCTLWISTESEEAIMPRNAVDDNERMNLRVRPEVKARLVRAAALRNTDLTNFVTQSALREAEAVIHEAEVVTVSERDFMRVMDLLENPPAPNARLRAAARALPKSL